MSSTTLLTLLNNRSMLGAARSGIQIATLTPSKDTYLDSGNPTHNFGALTLLGYGTDRFPCLIQFDLSTIPAGSVCISARLRLYKSGTNTAQAYIGSIYTLKSANGGWGEGTKSGAPGGNGECSWNNKDQGAATAWAGSVGLGTAGTDYDSVAIGSVTGNAADAIGTIVNTTLNPSIIQTWFGNAANYGMIIKWDQAVGSFASREASSEQRPQLIIEWK